MSTIALHFDFSAMSGALWDAPERIVILERVLRALCPIEGFPGRTSIGMVTLFHSWRDVERNRAGWLNSLDDAAVQCGSIHPKLKAEFSDILVIVISGRLERLPSHTIERLKRPRSFRFLFAVQFAESAPPDLRSRYFGTRATLLGSFTGDRQFVLCGESMFFEGELQPMWARLGIDAAYTTAAFFGAYALAQSSR